MNFFRETEISVSRPVRASQYQRCAWFSGDLTPGRDFTNVGNRVQTGFKMPARIPQSATEATLPNVKTPTRECSVTPKTWGNVCHCCPVVLGGKTVLFPVEIHCLSIEYNRQTVARQP